MPPQRLSLKDKVEQSKRQPQPQNKSRIEVERYYEPSVGTGRFSDRVVYTPDQAMRKSGSMPMRKA